MLADRHARDEAHALEVLSLWGAVVTSPGQIALQKRAALQKQTGHKLVSTGVGMSDQYVCSCGWKSHGYWDGFEWCQQEFDAHLKKVAEGQS